jgi:hypothetical protein
MCRIGYIILAAQRIEKVPKRKTGPRYVDESAREIEEIGASCWGFFRREFFSSTIFRKLHDFS